jgi:hypothetical protein
MSFVMVSLPVRESEDEEVCGYCISEDDIRGQAGGSKAPACNLERGMHGY